MADNQGARDLDLFWARCVHFGQIPFVISRDRSGA